MKQIKKSISLNYRDVKHEINKIAKKTNKNKLSLLIDLFFCHLKYKSDAKDYSIFEMYNMNQYERKTLVTKGINLQYMIKYNDPKFMHIFHNKAEFNKTFNRFLNRDWLELNSENKNEFAHFCLKHNFIMAKSVHSQYGDQSDKIDTTVRNLKELYEELMEDNKTVIEEVAIQCHQLRRIHPESINTIHVITFLGNVVSCYLQMGNNHSINSNFEQGGLVAPIDINTGIIISPAIDKEGNVYSDHPLTKVRILGLEIPRFQEIIHFCESAALEVPQVGYLCWEVGVGVNQCFFMEANEFPEHIIYNLPPHRQNNKGILPEFKKIEERKFEI
ncbi:MAG: hypothetical protein HFH86_03365 [Bacilli bacterium]|jgi:hypothetical protein|nr:hypothetical protein [Bacilli bacterium]